MKRIGWYCVALLVVFLVAITLRIGTPNLERHIVGGDETTYNYAALNMMKYHAFVRRRRYSRPRSHW